MSESKAPKGIHAERVTDWLVENVGGLEPPLGFALITGGHSNLTYSVTDQKGRKLVLRRPPLGAVLATAHDMGREHKIISAVGGTGVPVPDALGLCTDESVNDAPFYIMDFVEGHVLTTSQQTAQVIPDEGKRHALGERVIDVLARLHTIDPDQIGLGDLGRKEAYLDRQLKRWRTQWEKSKTRELDSMEKTYDLLIAAKPEQKYTGIVHGDYRLGNMLTTDDADIAAVLDWELCTLGDTLADVGYLLNNWVEPGESPVRGGDLAPTAAGGFPTRDEFVAAYSEKTGHEVANIDYYRSFQSWRLAAIVEGVLARYLKGVMGDPNADTSGFRISVDRMADEALRLIRKLG
ncbi:MAG: phosphotransferase family protein [Deltaproteobacteria bacterium]|nr:phosphotransferase family protein [Deltaproteobacteria bacterium]MBW2416181.1 phosphotransferase family protein [Deltaproteobacteria bacterium]